jgi:hypothetical protein
MSTVFIGVALLDSFEYSNAMTIRDLMEAVGGVRSAARLLGVAPSTAHYYCKHNRVPLKRLLLLASVAGRLSSGEYSYEDIIKEFV